MKIFFASTNLNKAKELGNLIAESGHSIVLPGEAGVEFDFEETARTFYENALGKAKALFDIVSVPVIAEDSGLCVPALNGEPGVYSARYGGDGVHKLSDKERNNYLLGKMAHLTEPGKRGAFFVCSMVLLIDSYRFFVCQETLKGEITFKPSGENGFGYDPLFFVPELDKTMAEIPLEEKNKISHRGKAGRQIACLVSTVLGR
jgi:XTP/dITP diphosphohydrolase